MSINKSLTKIIHLVLAAGTALLLLSCASGYPPQGRYPNHPRSILVMPPVNLSFDVDAQYTFLATSAYPLAEAGYYVLPVTLTMEMFRQNGVTVAEEAHALPHARLHEIFGADAAIYITITQYGSNYYFINSIVQAWATARLVDLRNGAELWSGEVRVNDNTSVTQDSIIGILVEAAFDQIANVLTNKAYDTGRKANYQLLSASRGNIKYGPYHPDFEPDVPTFGSE